MWHGVDAHDLALNLAIRQQRQEAETGRLLIDLEIIHPRGELDAGGWRGHQSDLAATTLEGLMHVAPEDTADL